jgi:hypothetical protein
MAVFLEAAFYKSSYALVVFDKQYIHRKFSADHFSMEV